MISEWSCDTEDWINDAENRSKSNFKIIIKKKNQINISLSTILDGFFVMNLSQCIVFSINMHICIQIIFIIIYGHNDEDLSFNAGHCNDSPK